MPHRKASFELYDLSQDPEERHDLASAHPDVVATLTDEITAIVRNGRSTTGPVQANDQPWWDDLTWLEPPQTPAQPE